jgi:hypothetical protein
MAAMNSKRKPAGKGRAPTRKRTNPQNPSKPKPAFNYREQFGVIVLCASEAEHQKVYDRLQSQGYSCRLVSV